ncbi:MAG: hypothetical protein KDK99_06745, partial [Verrucomicrobiales bacterium]|nr:hypothetical protein [Verrucomicrobiales bacterium]
MQRREFVWLASSGVCGLFGAGAWGAGPESGREHDPADLHLVELGLNAMARSVEGDYFADGHRGASLISAHLLAEENALPTAARTRIERLFDANWAQKPLCRPFPEADPVPDAAEQIGEALLEAGDSLRQVGHNAIFAMLAIKAFRMLPRAATPERVAGIAKLIRAMTPWRDEAADPDLEIPPFTQTAAASRFVLAEASAAVERFKDYGQGFAGHMLTFGQSLIELAAMGDVEWAEGCRTAFAKYVTVTRQGPQPDDRKIAEHGPSPLRPTMNGYWQKRGEKT